MKCKDIIKLLEELAPPSYACEWDNPGLVCGRRENEVTKILVALDATNKAVKKAVEEGADFIVTHHPMIFSGISSASAVNSSETPSVHTPIRPCVRWMPRVSPAP